MKGHLKRMAFLFFFHRRGSLRYFAPLHLCGKKATDRYKAHFLSKLGFHRTESRQFFHGLAGSA